MRYLVLDLETTGLSPSTDRVLELALVDVTKFCATGTKPSLRQLRAQNFMFDPGFPIPPESTKIHGITDSEVSGMPGFGECVAELQDLLGGAILIGHHVQFDIAFLTAEFARSGVRYRTDKFCTLSESRDLLPELESHKLETLNRHFMLSTGRAHRAAKDAKTTALLYFHLLDLRRSRPSSSAPVSSTLVPVSGASRSKGGASRGKVKATIASGASEPPKRLNSKAYKKAVSGLKAQLKALDT